MNNIQILLLIVILASTVWATRFLPFVIFKNTANLPKIIDYLGKVLPAAMMGLLVIYCLKDLSFEAITKALPTLLSVATVVIVHLLKKNTLLSIFSGTLLYMILIRLI